MDAILNLKSKGMNITEINFEAIKELARKAGAAILEIYNQANDFGIEQKSDDSPITKADKISNEIICKGIESLDLGYPIISEENLQTPFEVRKNYKRFWLIDPLDGTKEFIKRNGDFTVNIALIEGNRPIAGFIYTPCKDELFWGIKGQAAFYEQNNVVQQLNTAEFDIKNEGLRVVASRSHLDEATLKMIEKLHNPKIFNRGSSLKFMLLAKGLADYYPRMSQTMEWDIAAAQIILEESGGKIIDHVSGKALEYNKESMKIPGFIACGNGNPLLF